MYAATDARDDVQCGGERIHHALTRNRGEYRRGVPMEYLRLGWLACVVEGASTTGWGGSEQSVLIVGDDLCREVMLQGRIGQPGHRLQVQAVPDVLQGLFDAPAAPTQRTEFNSGTACLIEQRDCPNARRSARLNITNRAYVRAFRGAARRWSHQRAWAHSARRCSQQHDAARGYFRSQQLIDRVVSFLPSLFRFCCRRIARGAGSTTISQH